MRTAHVQVMSDELERFLDGLIQLAGGDVMLFERARTNVYTASLSPTFEDLVRDIVRLKSVGGETPDQ